MTEAEAARIITAHGLDGHEMSMTTMHAVAQVLAAKDAKATALCDSYAKRLWSVEGENARLRAENARLQAAFSRIASGSAAPCA